MALQFGTPIVPVSIVGAFEFNKKTSWLIRPGTVTVYLHDVIETKDLKKEDFPALRDRVHAIIAGPIDEARSDRELRVAPRKIVRTNRKAANSSL